MSADNTPAPKQEPEAVTFATFLESVPPMHMAKILSLAPPDLTRLVLPDLKLHCTSDECNGVVFFRCDKWAYFDRKAWCNVFLEYWCSNCKEKKKTFSVAVFVDSDGSGSCYKYGEAPSFGPPTSRRLLKLLGDDKALFLKGRQCENQGLGIGAFGYYRQVVERQKVRLLDTIIGAATKTGASGEIIAGLQAAKEERQFKRAMELAKDAIPPALIVDGQHSPMEALYSALSKGLHGATDEQCLQWASSIRLVLAYLSDRLAAVLADKAELLSAINELHTAETDDDDDGDG